MTMKIEIVASADRFAAVRGAWQALWDRSGGSVFQAHDWLAGWLDGMRDRREVRFQLALAWEADRLCGAMPCAIHRRSGLRILTWAAQLFTDYCDCLVDPAHEAASVLGLLWDGLWQSGGFDLINLQQVRPDSRCRDFLDGLVRDGTQLQVGERQERCMRIENHWADGQAFFRSLNKKGRNNHTRGKRILAELGGAVTFRLVDGQDDGSPALLDEIIRLKRNWLRATDPASPLLGSDEVVLRAILNNMVRCGLARIFLLEANGKIAAASVNFVYGGRMEAYFTSYDPVFDRASPGTILIVEYACWSFDRGLKHVDFLRGEEAFKFRMANAETVLSSFSGARTLVGQVAVSGHRWLARRRHRQDATARPPELESVD